MNYKKPIVNVIMLYLMIMCFALAVGYGNNAKAKNEVANIYLESLPMTAADINEMQKAEETEDVKLSFTGWKQIDNETLSYPYFERTATADVIQICGDSSLIIDAPILFLGDSEGCIVDEDTAYSLFGSLDVVGDVITYNDRELTIIAVQNKLKNTVIMQTAYNSNENMNAIALELNGKGSRRIKDFTNRYGISTYAVESTMYSNIANVFIIILPLIIITLLLVKFIKKVSKLKRTPILFLLYIIVGCLFVGVFIKIMEVKLSIPYDLIPNKWSDFEYWGNLFKEYREKYETILYMKKYNMDIILIQSMFKSICFSILAITICLNLRKKIKASNSKELFILISTILIFEFTVILIARLKLGLEINELKIWLLIPYYYLANYVIHYASKTKKNDKEIHSNNLENYAEA